MALTATPKLETTRTGTSPTAEVVTDTVPTTPELTLPNLAELLPIGWGGARAATEVVSATPPTGQVAATGSTGKTVWKPQTSAVVANFNRDEFAKSPVSAQKAKLGELQVQRAALQSKIMERTDALDQKWSRATVSTKSQALRQYHERSKLLDPVTRTTVKTLVKKSDEQQRKIDELRVKSDAMCKPDSQVCTAAEVKAQDEIAGKLADARDAQEAAVNQATAAVDAKGLKVDRLAVTEAIIDPNAPPAGPGNSLMELVDSFVEYTEIIESIKDVIEDIHEQNKQLQAEQIKEAERVKEEVDRSEVRKATLKQLQRDQDTRVKERKKTDTFA